jgi:type I restriction enzyme S subunit
MCRLKHVTSKIIDGTHVTPTYTNDGIPFLRVTDIVKANNSDIDMQGLKYISEEEYTELSKRCWPQKGDLLYSKNGTIGVPRVIDWDWEFSIFVSLCLIKIEKNIVNPEYLSIFLQSKVTQNQIAIGSKSNTVTNLHLDKIKEFIFVFPPKKEQLSIIQVISEQIDKINSMKNANQRTIERLQEYRTALITAAVTGKIDVRDIPIPDQEAMTCGD